jgi:hypothetical protein
MMSGHFLNPAPSLTKIVEVLIAMYVWSTSSVLSDTRSFANMRHEMC